MKQRKYGAKGKERQIRLQYINNSCLFIAHIFLKRCKQTMLDWKKDLDGLTKKLAVCLYTIQSFYSNTNWIEMFGDKVYEDFGERFALIVHE